ncbi:MAG: efflux RND transporter periplasmic adaptor subunit, partial [bacterium]
MNKPDLHVDRHHDDEHLGEEHNEPERAVKLHEEDIKEFGIEVEEAGRGTLTIQLELPGEITPNADRLAHIVPRAAGVVVSVFKSEGERVRTGELLAVLDSRELADVKASYLAAIKRTEIARTNAEREKELWKKRISPELDYLEARRILDESTIELNSVEQKLHAYGLSDEYLRQLPLQPDMTYTRYELRAPFEGTIIEKHITIGEVLREDSQAFVIADLSSVWVNISVYQKDMASLRKGQSVS